jgi:hypothetical protein
MVWGEGVQAPFGADQQSVYIAARRVLLDALTALAPHGKAVVLIGAQAVYLHAESANLGVAAYTSDGDLGLDPEILGDEPLLEEAMTGAGFSKGRDGHPGIWWKSQLVGGQPTNIEVDLLVPHALSSGGRRTATIPPHHRRSVLRVPGIEVAMEDHKQRTIGSLEESDDQSLDVEVAGVAALLVAKAFKLATRLDEGRPERLIDKDASDVLGLMIASDPTEISRRFAELLTSDRVGDVAAQGLQHLIAQFGARRSPGVEMAVRALEGVRDAAFIEAFAPTYMAQLRIA